MAPPGALVVTAGACPLGDNWVIAGVGDVLAQARQAVVNLTEALAAAGASLTDVLDRRAEGNRLRRLRRPQRPRGGLRDRPGAFAGHDAPSTLLGVIALGYRGRLAEIEAVAAQPAQ